MQNSQELAMTQEEAFKELDLTGSESKEEQQARFFQSRGNLDSQITNAPTPMLKTRYESKLQRVLDAAKTVGLMLEVTVELPTLEKANEITNMIGKKSNLPTIDSGLNNLPIQYDPTELAKIVATVSQNQEFNTSKEVNYKEKIKINLERWKQILFPFFNQFRSPVYGTMSGIFLLILFYLAYSYFSPNGNIEIITNPVGANVVNALTGSIEGKTPYYVNKKESGIYEYIVKLEGYKEKNITVKLRDIKTRERIDIILDDKSNVILDTTPTGAEVISEGFVNKTTPFRSELKPGKYNFVFKKEGYAEETLNISITKEGEKIEKIIKLITDEDFAKKKELQIKQYQEAQRQIQEEKKQAELQSRQAEEIRNQEEQKKREKEIEASKEKKRKRCEDSYDNIYMKGCSDVFQDCRRHCVQFDNSDECSGNCLDEKKYCHRNAREKFEKCLSVFGISN